MKTLFTVSDENGTERLGAALAELLPDGTVVALVGPLGAGKTRLVQAVAAACSMPREDVTSPTFVLIQEYHGARSIHHFDAFRIADEDEFNELGPEEYFDSTALTFVEWADRVERSLPANRIEIRIEPATSGARSVEVTTCGACSDAIVEALALRMTPGQS